MKMRTKHAEACAMQNKTPKLLSELMPPTQRELGERIAEARERSGLSQLQVAGATGLSQSAISRIESGERAVDALELAAFCELLGISALDLLEDRPLSDALVQLSGRVAKTRAPGAVDAAQARVRELVRTDELLAKLGNPELNRPDVPSLTSSARLHKDQGRDIASRLRATLELGDQPIPDLVEIVEETLGLDVALEPLVDAVEGLCVRTNGLSIALVNSSPVVGRQRFTLAHELCHYVVGDVDPFHIDEDLFGRGAAEVRANSFAAHFLMPDTGLRGRARGRPIDGRVVCELQYAFGVSLDALLWQLHNLHLITGPQRDEYRAAGPRTLALRHGFVASWMAARSLERQVRPPARLARRALAAYEQGLIGVERLAAVLGRADVDALRLELEDAGIGPNAWPEDTAQA
jgi:Zn-dependent peptidase ImmA (M78 family)/DNA-binding XRE family transcriptional regulator